MTGTRIGAIEAGGAKFICAVGTASGELLDEARIPTRDPVETMADVIAFFRDRGGDLAALGIGSFGPIDLRRESPHYGFITSTPKEAWRNFNFVGALRKAFNVPIGFDTDVNAAALAESRWGAGRELRSMLYVTVGTGVGGGAITEGALLHGLLHPEMGHIRVPHDLDRDPFPGICPYHGDCLEGLASGLAIEARWGVPPPTLPPDHAAWRLEAEYIGLACVNWICTLSPERIVMGGGVMQAHLFPSIRECASSLLGGYVEAIDGKEMDSYIVPPGLGGRAGILGALALGCYAAGLS
jgi:fructokinase